MTLRVCTAVIFGLVGWYIAGYIQVGGLPWPFDIALIVHLLLVVGFGVVAVILIPPILVDQLRLFLNEVNHASGSQIVADFAGFALGLLLGALMAFPLALLPDPFRQILPLLAAIFFAYMGALIMNTHYREIFAVFNIHTTDSKTDVPAASLPAVKERLLLDTSVIIDGRIADIYDTGFIRSELVVPRFVLNELQRVADATEGMRRMRGRRGLEVLKRLQEEDSAVRIADDDPEAAGGVDDKLVLLAKQWSCPIVTNDYNLNKAASLQGVAVLNINELANAVKTVLIPGETLNIHVIQEGKENGQGVGYLEDGTMVVIEDGRAYLNRNINVTVTKVLQTAAGKMIFAKP